MARVIGVAGTAKNTGKTTTLQAAARFLRGRGAGVFLTSIGYDGEDIDTVTGLPKPKVVVEEGDAVATALPLLEASPARFASVTPTGVECALGPIYSGVATSPGKVVLAGPVSTKDVATVCRLTPPGRTVLLDGAFSRLAPMVLADALIIATGAARSTDPRRIAQEMEALATVFGLPAYSPNSRVSASVTERLPSDADFLKFPAGLYVDGQDETLAAQVIAALGPDGVKDLSAGKVGKPKHVEGACMAAERAASGSARGPRILIDGVVNPAVFSSMIRSVIRSMIRRVDGPTSADVPGPHILASTYKSIEIILSNPIFMLLSGDMTDWKKTLANVVGLGFRVSVYRKPKLLGFTVNPFRPVFDPILNAYAALYVDARAYLREIRSLTSSRCTDIVHEGTSVLESWLSEAR